MATTTPDTTAEQDAIRADASRRLPELRNAARRLQHDQDDAEVLSELCIVRGQVRQAEAILTPGGAASKVWCLGDAPGSPCPAPVPKMKVTK